MASSKSKINPALRRFDKMYEEISAQTSRLKKFNLGFIAVPREMKLRQFKAWPILPKEFVEELNELFIKIENKEMLRKLGVSPKELLHQEWVHRFFRWKLKTNAQSESNQKKSFGGRLLEKKILNDANLDQHLLASAKKVLLLLQNEIGNKSITFADGKNILPQELRVKRATDFVDLNGRDFLDFGYLFVSDKGAGTKALPGIEIEIKQPGVVHKYYDGQGDRGTERFPKGFSCLIDGKRTSFKPDDLPDDILEDKSFAAGTGKALIHPDDLVPKTDYMLSHTRLGRFTVDITYKTRTQDIKDFIDELYRAKRKALSRIH